MTCTQPPNTLGQMIRVPDNINTITALHNSIKDLQQQNAELRREMVDNIVQIERIEARLKSC